MPLRPVEGRNFYLWLLSEDFSHKALDNEVLFVLELRSLSILVLQLHAPLHFLVFDARQPIDKVDVGVGRA